MTAKKAGENCDKTRIKKQNIPINNKGKQQSNG
jgi:hypothetical protein